MAKGSQCGMRQFQLVRNRKQADPPLSLPLCWLRKGYLHQMYINTKRCVLSLCPCYLNNWQKFLLAMFIDGPGHGVMSPSCITPVYSHMYTSSLNLQLTLYFPHFWNAKHSQPEIHADILDVFFKGTDLCWVYWKCVLLVLAWPGLLLMSHSCHT